MSLNLLLTPNILGPFYMDTLHVNNIIYDNTITIPISFTGAYTGGSGRIFLNKSGNMINLILKQDTTANDSSVGPLIVSEGLPPGYHPTNPVSYACVCLNATTARVPGIFTILGDGSIQIDTLAGGFTAAQPAGLLNSFSCSYMTTQ